MKKEQKMKTIKTSHTQITYHDDDDTKNKVFEALLEWYTAHEAFDGETIQQCDEPLLDAPNILSDIADNCFQFKCNYE